MYLLVRWKLQRLNVPAPDSDQVSEVILEFGAGALDLNPGADEALISGTATYNVAEFEPKSDMWMARGLKSHSRSMI